MKKPFLVLLFALLLALALPCLGALAEDGYTLNSTDGVLTITGKVNMDDVPYRYPLDYVSLTVDAGGKITGGTLDVDGVTFITVNGTISGGHFNHCDIALGESGIITGGTFSKEVSGDGTIKGGTFNGEVDVSTITGGEFYGPTDASTIGDGKFYHSISSHKLTSIQSAFFYEDVTCYNKVRMFYAFFYDKLMLEAPDPVETGSMYKYGVLLSASPEGAGTVTGASGYNPNTTAQVRATPAAGYRFVGWSKEGDSSIFSTRSRYLANLTDGGLKLVAHFEPHTCELLWVWSDTHHWQTCTEPDHQPDDVSGRTGYGAHDFAPATCDAPATCKVCGKTSGEALGHDLEFVCFRWRSNPDRAVAVYLCKNGCGHTEDKIANYTFDSTIRPATCGEEGEEKYSVSYEDHSDFVTRKVPKAEHLYLIDHFEWGEQHMSAQAVYICANDSSHIDKRTANVRDYDLIEPTCEDKGIHEYIAECDHGFNIYQEDLPPKGHFYNTFDGFNWTWDGEKYVAKVMFLCANDREHIQYLEPTSTSSRITKEPTCDEGGIRTYTASYMEGFQFHDDVLNESIVALGHNYQYDHFEWAADSKTADAVLLCQNDDSHTKHVPAQMSSEVNQPSTCDTAGSATYTAAYDGAPSETRTVSLPALEHDYQFERFEWSADGTTADAVCTCKNDSVHSVSFAAAMTYNDTIPATDTDAGERVYTATYMGNSEDNTVTMPALGHKLYFDSFVWAADYTAQAKLVCANNPAHVELHDATVSYDVTTPPTESAEGVGTYTAIYGESRESVTVTIPALPAPPVLLQAPKGEVTQGEEALFVSSADFDQLIQVRVDGKVIRRDIDYTAVSGSTKVTLRSAYTSTLPVGKHTLEIVSTSGIVSATFIIAAKIVPLPPKTGDASDPLLWSGLLLAALIGAGVLLHKDRKHKLAK